MKTNSRLLKMWQYKPKMIVDGHNPKTKPSNKNLYIVTVGTIFDANNSIFGLIIMPAKKK